MEDSLRDLGGNNCLPLQDVPFPVNPCLQEQLKEPSLLVHSAFSSHGLVSAEHSSISYEMEQRNS